jgi:hypothetical protein
VAIEADGTDPDFLIDQVELTSGTGAINFRLTNDRLWPVGRYKVDLYLDEVLDRTLDFEVVGDVAVVQAPEPTATPVAEPTSTPVAEPTATPEPTVTAAPEPSATRTPKQSAGDTLSQPPATGDTLGSDPEDTSEQTPEPLPLSADPYLHPSGAFGFAVPEGWTLTEEAESYATFGFDEAIVGVEFINTGGEYDDREMEQFIELYLERFVPASDYQELTREVQPDGSTYVAITFKSSQDESIDSDFFFEQHGPIIYVLYFSTFIYDELAPTWEQIIASYAIDPEAAQLVAPSSTSTAIPAVGLPTATPAPATNPFVPPAGVARVYMQNFYTNEYNIDFGDGSGSLVVPPRVENFYHDLAPGNYNPGLSLPAGGATNVEFNIAVDEAWLIVVDEDLSVNWGKVYP